MKHEAGMTFQPVLHVVMLMRSIIVDDEMERHLTRKVLVQNAQEAEKLLMPMALIALSDDLSLQGFQRRE